MKFGMQIEVNDWRTTVCRMTRSKVKVKVKGFWSSENCTFPSVSPQKIYNENWQMATSS